MIKTELQKLARSIHKSLGDNYFFVSLQRILKTGVADIPSLLPKLRDIHNNLGSLETASDKATEIKAATQFSYVPSLSCIGFGENPDLRIGIGSEILSIEVKRFRFRPEDKMDTEMLANYNGILRPYGNPQQVQLQIEDVLLEKGRKYTGKDPFFIYLWSDSSHQVEDSEIKCAARSVREVIGGKLLGVFYKWAAYERNLILLESNPFTDKIEELLKPIFSVSK